MINLNLINPIEKKTVTKEQLIILIKNIISLLLVFIIFVGILFLICKVYLEKNYHEVVAQTTLVNIENKWISEEVKSLNSELKEVDKIQAGFVKWSEVLNDFFGTIPQDNQLISLDFDVKAQKINMAGKSLKRDNFLEFKENLENFELFENLESPLSNLLSKENINFTFSADFNKPQAK